jgi:GT2 family glycosyltransferase
VLKQSDGADIIVIDNASTDGSVEFIKGTFPQVRIIQNPSNLGYAGGYNRGLEGLTHKYFILLNSDVEVTSSWIEPIIERMESETSIGIVQPKILDAKRRTHFEYAGACGGFLDRYAYPYCRGRLFDTLEEDKSQYDDALEVHWASGACFFIRRELFLTLGGLDEDLFAHMEEIDLCWRARGKGHKVYCEPRSMVFHQGGATLDGHSPFKSYLNFRNNLIMLVKNDRSGRTGWLVFVRMLMDGLSIVRFITQLRFRHAFAVLKAHIHFYSSIGSTLKKRAQLKGQSAPRSDFSVVLEYFLKGKKAFSELPS